MEDYSIAEDIMHMREALIEAEKAFELGEVPIGAVIVIDGIVVSRAHNMKEQWKDATAHAEMVALKQATDQLGHWRHLKDATLYVTVEPCPMCAGAIVNSRIKRLVYGTADPKAGAIDSLMNVVRDSRLNHQVEVVSGVLQAESGEIMSRFFQKLRDQREK